MAPVVHPRGQALPGARDDSDGAGPMTGLINILEAAAGLAIIIGLVVLPISWWLDN